MYFNIINAEYVGNYKIKLIFENNKTGIVDLEDYIQHGEIFEPIREMDNFRLFRIDYGTLTWENGTIDIAPETLYTKTTGEPVMFDKTGSHRAG